MSTHQLAAKPTPCLAPMQATRGLPLLRRLAIAASALLVAVGTLAAEEQSLVLDSSATEIHFTLGATGHTVEGELFLRSGKIVFDLGTGAAAGTLTIDAKRTSTQNEKRDRKMHETVLESADYRLILFKARSIRGELPAASGSGPSRVALSGEIVLLGRSHPTTLAIEVTRSEDRLTAVTSFTVPYVSWGLHDPSVFVLRVAKEVEVTLTARGALRVGSEP